MEFKSVVRFRCLIISHWISSTVGISLIEKIMTSAVCVDAAQSCTSPKVFLMALDQSFFNLFWFLKGFPLQTVVAKKITLLQRNQSKCSNGPAVAVDSKGDDVVDRTKNIL
jgi:Na+/phosphate symporter